VLKLNKV